MVPLLMMTATRMILLTKMAMTTKMTMTTTMTAMQAGLTTAEYGDPCPEKPWLLPSIPGFIFVIVVIVMIPSKSERWYGCHSMSYVALKPICQSLWSFLSVKRGCVNPSIDTSAASRARALVIKDSPLYIYFYLSWLQAVEILISNSGDFSLLKSKDKTLHNKTNETKTPPNKTNWTETMIATRKEWMNKFVNCSIWSLSRFLEVIRGKLYRWETEEGHWVKEGEGEDGRVVKGRHAIKVASEEPLVHYLGNHQHGRPWAERTNRLQVSKSPSTVAPGQVLQPSYKLGNLTR